MKAWASQTSAGTTLLEVLVAATIFAALLGSAFMVSISAGNAYNAGMLDLSLQLAANTTMESMNSQLAKGYLAAANLCEPSRILFQTAVDHDGDGDFVDDDLYVDWGAETTKGNYLSFEFDGAGCPVLQEKEHGFDYNHDGDKADALQTGST